MLDMFNIKETLKDLHKKEMYGETLALIRFYIKSGYGVDEQIIFYYLEAKIMARKIRKAYNFLRNFEKVDKSMPKEILARLYYKCYKSSDAERVLKDNTEPLKDPLLLVKIYLRQGKIAEAKQELDEVAEKYKDTIKEDALNKFRGIIRNYYNSGSFIETDYESFVKNGKKLEPGHIIFIGNGKPSSIKTNPEDFDEKAKSRPYMIWKIEGNDIYMFPVLIAIKNKGYILYEQNYLNSNADRTIKAHLCKTTIDNVLSVQDKVSEYDYPIILRFIFTSVYFGKEENKIKNRKFMQDKCGEPELYNIIETVEPVTKIHHYYFVYEKTDRGYIVYEFSYNDSTLISLTPQLFPKSMIFYSVAKIYSETIEKLLTEIKDSTKKSNKIRIREQLPEEDKKD